jgi:succinate dehydrogenase assembly factor 1
MSAILKFTANCCCARTEFDKNVGLDKKDFGAIEYLLRKGQRQVEMYSAPGIKDIK